MMNEWQKDIYQHREYVQYYMHDFVSFAESACDGEIERAELDKLDLYGLMQHAIYWRGAIPDQSARLIGSQLYGAIGCVKEWEWAQMPRILKARAAVHDLSKFHDPEADTFKNYTPKLKTLTYGSAEYGYALAAMGPGLKHHYAVNSHHPEHYPDGVNEMSFPDIIEMFCDWVAATRKNRGVLDISFQSRRFGIREEMELVLENTLEY